MGRWNFVFDGTSSDFSIDEFIMRVEHLSKTNNLSNQMLADNLYVLLKGLALNYYWKCIKTIIPLNWDKLKQELSDKFQNLRTKPQLRLVLNARKQKPGESFDVFYNSLQEMASSMQTNIPNQEMLNLIRNNMRPALQMSLAIQKYSHIGELVRDCITTEENWVRFNYNPDSVVTPRRTVNEISPSGCDEHSNHVSCQEEICAFRNHKMTPNSGHSKSFNPTHSQQSTTNQKCWNCEKYGHTFKDCELSTKTGFFCYGCGKPGVLKPNCVQCSENKHRSMNHGVTHTSTVPYPKREVIDVACNVDPELIRHSNRK